MTTKVMSLTQWKVLTQIKEYYNKYSNDKTFQQLFNKEFASLLQKVQPSVYGNEMVKGLEPADPKADGKVVRAKVHVEQQAVADPEPQASSPTKEPGYNFNNVLTGLKLKIGRSAPKHIVSIKQQWRKNQPTVSSSSVTLRTRHVISMISSAECDDARLRRIEDLTAHVQQFPEAKHDAFKEGAVRLLLRIRANNANPEIAAAIRESFAVLGYMGPVPGRGIRILSVDGGGTRGVLVIAMLRKLQELTGRRVHEMFDLICGVSTGAIISCALGANQKDLLDLHKYYKDLSNKIFSQNAFWGTSSLVWSHSYYDTKAWEQILKDYFGEADMVKSSRLPSSPKVIAVSAVVNQSRASVYLFRNYSLPYRVQSQYMGGSKHKTWEAVRASAAAPTYFEEFKLGNLLHQDGGIMVNNPTAVAIHEARQLWPNVPLQCVVSFGTGRHHPLYVSHEPVDTGNSSSWKNKFLKILDSATDTESVHMMLQDLLDHNVYYRFNPYLTEMLDMVETRSEKLEQLERDAMMYMRRNEDKFQAAAKTLQEPRTAAQKALDWIQLQREIFGVTAVK